MRILRVALLAGLLAQTAAAPAPLTPDGWNGLRIGMSEKEAVRRFGLVVPSSDDGVSSEACRELAGPRYPGLVVMAEHGRVTRISSSDRSRRTDRGLTVGSTEREVRQAYKRIEVEPHKYGDPPARYLTYWDAAHGRGIRYETDQRGRVAQLHVGGPSIRYVEGCL